MAAVNTNLLGECMMFFKNADPRVYETFIRVLDQYTTELTVAVTEAPPAEVFNLQGRAQMARKFLKMFTEIREPNRPSP